MRFCTYLTVYRGNRMPPFYTGYSTVKNILEGNYHGSVTSREYCLIWHLELRYNPHLFKTYIITRHHTKREANAREIELQRKLNVLKNSLYINKAIGGYSDLGGRTYEEIHGKEGAALLRRVRSVSMTGKDNRGEKNPMYGKRHRTVSIELMRTCKVKEKHPQWGTHWYNDGADTIKCRPGDEPQGYVRGRIMEWKPWFGAHGG